MGGWGWGNTGKSPRRFQHLPVRMSKETVGRTGKQWLPGAYCTASCEEGQRMWWVTASRWVAGEPRQARSGQKPDCTTGWNSGGLRKWVQRCGLDFPEALKWKAGPWAGRQVGRQQAAGSRLLTADNMEGQRREGTGWEKRDKSELGFNKKSRKCFRLNSSKNTASSHVWNWFLRPSTRESRTVRPCSSKAWFNAFTLSSYYKEGSKKRCLGCASATLILSVASIHFIIFLRQLGDYNTTSHAHLLTCHRAKSVLCSAHKYYHSIK